MALSSSNRAGLTLTDPNLTTLTIEHILRIYVNDDKIDTLALIIEELYNKL